MKTRKTKKKQFFLTHTKGFSLTNINYSGYGYGKHHGGKVNIYGYDPNGMVFDYIVTYHRSKVLLRLLKSGEWWDYHPAIRSNYVTNGYTTRVGLKKANIDKCKTLSESHDLIPHGGKEAHDARVRIRNKGKKKK